MDPWDIIGTPRKPVCTSIKDKDEIGVVIGSLDKKDENWEETLQPFTSRNY